MYYLRGGRPYLVTSLHHTLKIKQIEDSVCHSVHGDVRYVTITHDTLDLTK